MKVEYADGVFEELVNLSFYLAERDEEIAQRFLDACDETFQLLAQNNLLGAVRNFKNKKLSEVRMWRIKGFNSYLVFYIPTPTGIKILHTLHSATDYNRAFENE
ncbi:MAG TPA: type II toxin-antitoxin system RelE/ParE family toxin [Pyrinomonadaceae bacterium]|jgi:toxin ParE1/3/4|nr:type II toxin-antitoxin system RelE/ParE family toxin [Pyrinomonadaceae bacterium]